MPRGIFPKSFEFDFNAIIAREQCLVTSLAYPDEFPKVIAMLAGGRLKAEPLITRTLSLEESVEEGLHRYEELAASNIRTLMVMEC